MVKNWVPITLWMDKPQMLIHPSYTDTMEYSPGFTRKEILTHYSHQPQKQTEWWLSEAVEVENQDFMGAGFQLGKMKTCGNEQTAMHFYFLCSPKFICWNPDSLWKVIGLWARPLSNGTSALIKETPHPKSFLTFCHMSIQDHCLKCERGPPPKPSMLAPRPPDCGAVTSNFFLLTRYPGYDAS